MYDKYFLSKDQLKILNNWSSSSNCPLIIYGSPGSGKTSLAKEILRNTVITLIDTSFLKNQENIYEYLVNIIQKKNITMMFQRETKNRGLLFDDLDLFSKYDKKSYKSILELLQSHRYYGSTIVATCNTKFINNRSLKKINFSKLYLNYDIHLYHKITETILKDKEIQLSFNQRNKLLFRSNYNLNTLMSMIDSADKVPSMAIDNFSSSEELYEDIFTSTQSMEEIARVYMNDKITVSLNLLENIGDYIKDLSILSEIYTNYERADIIDTRSINYYNMGEYYTIFTIYTIHLKIQSLKKSYLGNYRNNKYISRSLIYIHNKKKSNWYTTNVYLIYLYLYAIHTQNYTPEIIQYLKSIEIKEFEFYIQSFNCFYNSKLKKNTILN